MAKVREGKTVSVELAIKRELAYRKKAAAFLSEKEIAQLLPLEVPPPATNGASVSSLSPSARSLRLLPKPDVSAFICHVCKVDCTNSFNYKNHLRGHKHKARLKYKQLISSRHLHFICEVCEIWCEDEGSLWRHFNGRKHKANLLEAQLISHI